MKIKDEHLIADARECVCIMRETNTFPTGQGVLSDIADRLEALTACQQEVERLRGERDRQYDENVSLITRNAELVKALEWYGEQARLARLIHSEGDSGRHALAGDGGKRARAALEGQSNEA